MKYPLDSDLGLAAHIRLWLTRAMLPVVNGVLRLLPKPIRSDARCEVTRMRVPAEDGGSVPAVLFAPRGLDEAPCLVYCHGGGFVMRAAPHHYALARKYANDVPCKVLFVDYRLAPRHRWPTPEQDAAVAYRWVRRSAAALGVDSARIAVGGDSAGGCLAARVALAARDAGETPPVFQLLVYPVTDRRMTSPSMRAFRDTPMWDARLSAKMWRWYLPKDGVPGGTPVSPCEAASLEGLPDAYVETCEFDALRDEAAAYAEALGAAGVRVTLRATKGTCHGYDLFRKSGAAQESVRSRCAALREAFYIRSEDAGVRFRK